MRFPKVHRDLIGCEFINRFIVEVPAPLSFHGVVQLLDLLVVATA